MCLWRLLRCHPLRWRGTTLWRYTCRSQYTADSCQCACSGVVRWAINRRRLRLKSLPYGIMTPNGLVSPCFPPLGLHFTMLWGLYSAHFAEWKHSRCPSTWRWSTWAWASCWQQLDIYSQITAKIYQTVSYFVNSLLHEALWMLSVDCVYASVISPCLLCVQVCGWVWSGMMWQEGSTVGSTRECSTSLAGGRGCVLVQHCK